RVNLAALHVLASVPGAALAHDVAGVALERRLLRRAGDGVHVPQGDLGLLEGPRAAEAERATVAEHGERVSLAEQLLVRLAEAQAAQRVELVGELRVAAERGLG